MQNYSKTCLRKIIHKSKTAYDRHASVHNILLIYEWVYVWVWVSGCDTQVYIINEALCGCREWKMTQENHLVCSTKNDNECYLYIVCNHLDEYSYNKKSTKHKSPYHANKLNNIKAINISTLIRFQPQKSQKSTRLERVVATLSHNILNPLAWLPSLIFLHSQTYRTWLSMECA